MIVSGGVYVERSIDPHWDEVYGSGGRAAAAISGRPEGVSLVTYIGKPIEADVLALGTAFDIKIEGPHVSNAITFDYFHPLSVPHITPAVEHIAQHAALTVDGKVALRFGMLEGEAVVRAETAIHDPQSAFAPQLFRKNGSDAGRLAIVLNRSEAEATVGEADPERAATKILLSENADVVVVKQGGHGALIITKAGVERVPAYKSAFVWKIGTGDVFSAAFARFWGELGYDPAHAADLASRAVAFYSGNRSLPIPERDDLLTMEVAAVRPTPGRVYLAGPFFDTAQRWLIEEARQHLYALGADVFSPVHDVGVGPASKVAQEDIDGLNTCDAVLAIANGLDAGTLFEIGYAVAAKKPVIVLAQAIKSEDLKMIAGTGCLIVEDFATAIYQSIWSLER